MRGRGLSLSRHTCHTVVRLSAIVFMGVLSVLQFHARKKSCIETCLLATVVAIVIGSIAVWFGAIAGTFIAIHRALSVK